MSAFNFNRVILVGRLTRDPELRYTEKGMAIGRISLAVSRNWKNEAGELQEETAFVEIDAFGRQAETIGKFVTKGRPILIEGRLKLDQWEDRQTHQKRNRLGVVMERFSFLDTRQQAEGAPASVPAAEGFRQPAAAPAPPAASAAPVPQQSSAGAPASPASSDPQADQEYVPF